MKKTFILMLAAVVGFAGLSLAEVIKGGVMYAYTTADYYEDGTAVQDGEKYAVVWVADGSTFGGFNTDASLIDAANNKLVTDALRAKGGKLPYTQVNITEEMGIPDGGAFALVMMDTRTPAGTAAGDIINAYGQIASISNTVVGLGGTTSTTENGVTKLGAALPATIGNPVIKGIKIVGDKVQVTIAKTSKGAYYGVKGAKSLGTDAGFALSAGSTPKQGGADELVLEYPVTAGGQFFKAVGGNLNQVKASK